MKMYIYIYKQICCWLSPPSLRQGRATLCFSFQAPTSPKTCEDAVFSAEVPYVGVGKYFPGLIVTNDYAWLLMVINDG